MAVKENKTTPELAAFTTRFEKAGWSVVSTASKSVHLEKDLPVRKAAAKKTQSADISKNSK